MRSVSHFSGAMRLRTRSTRISPPPPGMEPSPAALNSEITSRSGILKTSAKCWNSGGLNPWILMCGYFVPDVPQQIDIPVELQLRVMPALHQNLHAAGRAQFIKLCIQLLVREDVVIGILLRPVKRAELAVNVADVGVVDVAIDDVGHDLCAAPIVALAFDLIAPRVRQRAEFFERQPVKLERIGGVKSARRREFARLRLISSQATIGRNVDDRRILRTNILTGRSGSVHRPRRAT